VRGETFDAFDTYLKSPCSFLRVIRVKIAESLPKVFEVRGLVLGE
jgi:hypothetical protein